MTTLSDLLAHTCTIVKRTAEAQGGYGPPACTDREAAGVPCRFSRPRKNETYTTGGIARQCDGKIFFEPAADIGMHDRIKDVKS